MNVLVVAPHPDDEAIGCGGAIRLHTVEQRARVTAVFLTSGERGIKGATRADAWRVRESEAEAAAEILGLAGVVFLRLPDGGIADQLLSAAEAVRSILIREQPDRVYLPHPDDGHADHRVCLPLLETAVGGGRAPRPTTIMGYEVWTPLAAYDDGEDITGVIADKVRAVRCHRSQVAQLRYDRAVRGLARYRGALAWGCRYAEVYRHLFLAADAAR